ncbi:hypothetical protein [Nitrosopumilus sp.]|uniref:hypothetical protein n=1 Tax=Nitrosopumilus sp. TaxID=2024843 RepID=UPI00261FF542|nr:hypothetical protein [Nitrosopumilus sp.]
MSVDDISAMLDAEFAKLQNLVTKATDSDMGVPEIVETYYQVMNVSSMCEMLSHQLSGDEHKPLMAKISETRDFISSNFDAKIHPKILDSLTTSIQETTKILQSSSNEKSQEDIEKESTMFEDLRKKMSTKEFVEQYQKGLS